MATSPSSSTSDTDTARPPVAEAPPVRPFGPPAAPATASPRATPGLTAAPRRRARWPARLLLIALVLAAAGGGAWYMLWRPLPVTITHPWRGPAIEAVYATGIVEAVDTARVGAVVAGRIVALPVEEGERVKQGQLLALLDDRQAGQLLADARARLALADAELARENALAGRGVHTVQALERARAERDRANATALLALRQVEDRRIVAPLDGIVMKREVELGETVAANAVMFDIASPARLRVAADVDERDMPRVRLGAPVAIRADAFPGEVFRAKVTKIRWQGDTATRTYRVEAALPAGTKLLIGMTVDTNIVVSEQPDALLVPPAAVRHDPPEGSRPGAAYVFQVKNGRSERTNVVLGATGPDAVQIRSGLAPNAAILARPPDALTPGRRVTVVK